MRRLLLFPQPERPLSFTARAQDAATSIFQVAPPAAQWGGAGVAVVVAALWHAFTGVLAAALVGLFLADVAIGVFKALHMGGVSAFEWPRFWKKFLELGAAMVGIVIAVCIDLLLREIGSPAEAAYFTSGFLGAVAVGFGASAVKNLAYFFPAVSTAFDALARREGPPKRRASDRGEDD
jgi:hypothetical protein